MKLYLTGGWGYRNLGDNAILVATVERILKQSPGVSLVVASFDVDETRKVLRRHPVSVVQSAHRRHWGLHPLRELEADGFGGVMRMPDSGFWIRNISRIQQRIRWWWSRRLDNHAMSKLKAVDEELAKDMAGCDALVVCGGGYLNQWRGCFLSHVMEWKAAARLGIPIKLIGPTIGPFDEWQTPFLKQYLGGCDDALVRDEKSCGELSLMGVDSKVVPDLALLDSSDEVVRDTDNVVLVIPGDLYPSRWDSLLGGLTRYAGSQESPVRFRFVTTRLYARDVAFARMLCDKLQRRGVEAEYRRPDDYEELLAQFDNARCLVSWNLHGLILAWRRGIPGVCLNIGRKFVSFMEQTNMAGFLMDWRKFTAEELSEKLRSLPPPPPRKHRGQRPRADCGAHRKSADAGVEKTAGGKVNAVKRITVVTWKGGGNFGTCLQGFALCRKLECCGYQVRILPDMPSAYDWKSWARFFLAKTGIMRFRIWLKSPHTLQFRKRMRWERKHYNPVRVWVQRQEKQLVKTTDCFVAGSDQIWNTYHHFNPVHFLGIENAKKKIAYASSIGTSSINPVYAEIVRKCLLEFDHIGVREDAAVSILSKLTGRKDIVKVLDPTLLLTRTDWSRFCDDAQIEFDVPEKYIFCYLVGGNPSYKKQLSDVRKCLGIENVIIVPSCENPEFAVDNCLVYKTATPPEFVELLAKAAFVCTDSFHATAFCINLNKPFVEFMRFNNGDVESQNSRIYDILERYDLLQRIYKEGSPEWKEHINYEEINAQIEFDRKLSIEYLVDSIEK